ncbi:MAG TPA: Na+/H+ antiporter subunit E [Pseudohongiella sp.]|nr:Na+/H+ antiporter subunit E [Pseudohongiella sp.]
MKIHTLSLLLILTAFWLLNSGLFKPLIFMMAAVSIGLVLFISARMKIIDEESQPVHLTRRVPGYYLWLLKELFVSNAQVVSTIWKGSAGLQPAMATIPMNAMSDMGKVIYANSISLTPGTVTTEVTDNSITVHALDKSSIAAIASGELEERVRKLD